MHFFRKSTHRCTIEKCVRCNYGIKEDTNWTTSLSKMTGQSRFILTLLGG